MHTVSESKIKKKCVITKVFSYIFLVFAFLFMILANNNKKVEAAYEWPVFDVAGHGNSDAWGTVTIGINEYRDPQGKTVYYNSNTTTGVGNFTISSSSGGTGICNVVFTFHVFNSSGTAVYSAEYKNSASFYYQITTRQSFRFSAKFNHGLFCASSTTATGSTWSVQGDSQKPSVSFSGYSSSWSKDNEFYATASDGGGSGLESTQLTSSKTNISYNYPSTSRVDITIKKTGTYTVTVQACDAVSNCTSASVTVKIDFDNPTYSSFSATTGGSYQKSTSIGAQLSGLKDSHSGLSNWVFICLDTSSSLTGEDLFDLNCSYRSSTLGTSSMGYFDREIPTGTYYLYVYAEDAVGNYVWAKASGTYYVDSTLPTESGSTSSSTTYVREKTVTLQFYDYHSKVKSITYCWAKNTSCTPSTTKTATLSGNYGSITLTKNGVTGIYYIYFYATDKAGNISTTYNRYYYLDYDSPDFSSISPSSDTTYTKSKTITVTYSDVYESSVRSGVKEILYCWTTSVGGCTPNLTLSSTGSVSITKNIDTGTYYLSTYGVDKAGNYSGVVTNGPYYFDNTAPSFSSATASSSTYVKSKTVSISYTDSHSKVDKIYYCWTTSSTSCSGYSYSTATLSGTTGTISITKSGVTGTYYLFTYATDKAGNTSATSSGIRYYYFDNTAPSLSSTTPDSDTEYTKSKSIQVKYYDAHSKVKTIYYCWTTSSGGCTPSTAATTTTASGSYVTATITKSGITGKYYLSTKAEDNVGNVSTATTKGQYYFDNAAPVFSSFADNGSTTWVKSREVTITYHDKYDDGVENISRSGVKYIYYCWAESTTSSAAATCTPSSKSESTGSLKITKNTGSGYWWLTVKAEDTLGNVSGTKTSPVFYFDNENPDNPTYPEEDKVWKQSKDVTLSSDDSYSGVDGFYYCTYFEGDSACTPTTSSSYLSASYGEAILTLTTSGKRYIRSFAVDRVGNQSSVTTSPVYWIDSTVPSLSSATSSSTTYVKSKSVSIKYYDEHSGVKSITYCWAKNTSCTPDTTVNATIDGAYGSISLTKNSVTGKYYIYYYATDNAGNVSATGNRYYYFDNTDPTFVSRDPNGDENYTKSKSVVVEYSDGHSGVKTIKYCWTTNSSGCTPSTSETATDGKITINRATGSGTYYLSTLAIDNAGNDSSSTTSTTKYKFDNTIPGDVSYSPVENTTYKKSQSVVVTYTDADSGVGKIQYCWSTSSSTTTCSSPSEINNGETVTRNTGTDEYYLVTRARDTSLKGDGGATEDYNWSAWSNSGEDGYYVDNTNPDDPTFNPNEDDTYTKSKTIEISSYDGHSGVKKIYYCWTTSSSGCTPSSSKTASGGKISVTKNTNTGIYYLSAYAEDNAGNTSGTTTSGAYYFDNTAPTFVSFSPDGNSGWQKQITVTVEYIDGHSGLKNISYCWTTSEDGCTPNTTVATTSTIDVPSETRAGVYYLSVKGEDNAGNVSEATTSNAYKLAVSQELKSDGTHVKYYHSIQLGLDGITAGNTLKVLLDSTSTLEGNKCLTNTKNITLNMDGKKMTCSIANTAGLTNSGELTIQGNGTMESSYNSINNTGTLTITNGTFTGSERGIYSNGGTVTINGGTITGSDNDGIHATGTLTINDGTVIGADDGVQNGSTGTTTINGGSVTGIAGAWNAAGGTMKVTGGTINGTSSSYGGLYNSATLEITGGTITGTYGVSNAGTATISGGTMSTLNNAGTVTISGTAKISGAASNSSSLTMSDGETGAMTSTGTTTLNGGTVASLEITDGTSTVNGATVSGTVKLSAEKVFNFYSGTIGELTSSGTVTMTGGTISGDTITNGSMEMSGGSASTVSNGGGLTISGSASTGKITNLCVLSIQGGTVAGVYNRDNTSVEGVNGELTMIGGTVSVTSGIAIEITAGTVSIGGGTVSGPTGISITEGELYVSDGTVEGTDSYAINATGGTVSYTGGTLKGNTTNIYTYYMKDVVSFSIGDRSEYTYISGSQYITTLVTKVATDGNNKEYNTLQAALNAGGTITLNKNVTDLSLTIASGKSVVLNLNGNTINSFITARAETTEGTTSFITNKGTLTVYNGTIELHREGIVINNKGELNYGVSGETGASLIAEEGYAIKNNAGNILNYVNGTLTSGDQHTVIDSLNKDLFIADGYYMDFSANAPYSVSLVEGTILGDITGSNKTEVIISGTTLTIKVNHERKIEGTDESVKVWLRIGGTVGEYAMTCKINTSNKNQTICTTTVGDSFAYLYNSEYSNELLVTYIDYSGDYIDIKEILRTSLLIIPEELNSDNTAGAEVNKEGYSLFSDGKTIMIALNSATIDDVSINEAVILKAIFGDNYATILGEYTVGLNSVDTSTCAGTNGCVGFDKTTMTITASYNGGYPAAAEYILNNQPHIMVYDYTPKFSETSVTALSATTCELGSACNVTPLSYYDYQGNSVGTVSNVITYNGEVVNSIDTRKLGTYLVTTVAEDAYGNRSKAVVREYKVVDTTSPVVEVSKEALVVKQGEELNDLDEIVVNDNYDKVLMIERISEEVDTNKVGTYRLGYRVVDSSGNITIVYRDVIVIGDHTNVIIVGVLISCLISIVVGVGTHHYIKRKNAHLN